jgi:hypothetical protein
LARGACGGVQITSMPAAVNVHEGCRRRGTSMSTVAAARRFGLPGTAG